MSNNVGSWTGSLKISDYITALATSATALFAWLAYRYALRSTDPIVECDEPRWTDLNRQIHLRVAVRNRSSVAHSISKVEVRKPKGSVVSVGDSAAVPAQTVDLSWTLNPVGSFTHVPVSPDPYATDQLFLGLFVTPPISFVSGKVCVVLIISDKSLRPRQRRFVISKFIQAAKTKITADVVNKTD